MFTAYIGTGRHYQSELPAGQYPSRFAGNVVGSSLGSLLYPNQGTPGQPTTQYQTYEAIHMAVAGDATVSGGTYDVNIRGNTINGAVYGIVANQAMGIYYAPDATMTGIRRRGLWLDHDQTLSPFGCVVTLDGTKTATA